MKIPITTTTSPINLSRKNFQELIWHYHQSPNIRIPKSEWFTKIATNERHDRKMDTKQDLFIFITWTTIPALQLIMFYPEVVWCDVTSHSNNTGFFFSHSHVGHQLINKLYPFGFGSQTNNMSVLDGFSSMLFQL